MDTETKNIAQSDAEDKNAPPEIGNITDEIIGESARRKKADEAEVVTENTYETAANTQSEKLGGTDETMMRLALAEAKKAEAEGEVPIGAVLVNDRGELLAASGNRKEREKNPLKHAEMIALNEGIRKFGKYLTGCKLYVTLEPCAMCAGAMVNARLGRLVFGAYDKKGGAAGTSMDVFGNPALNHAVAVTGGVLEAECAEILSAFFKRRREEKKCL